jgi:hypothetical protein
MLKLISKKLIPKKKKKKCKRLEILKEKKVSHSGPFDQSLLSHLHHATMATGRRAIAS